MQLPYFKIVAFFVFSTCQTVAKHFDKFFLFI
jgi:hypothetical protein